MKVGKLMHLLITALVTVFLFFASVGIYVAFAQSRYVYHPTREVEMTPGDVGLAFEELRLQAEDEETIHAWFVPCQGGEDAAKPTVLFCHGNGGNMGGRVGSLLTFNRLGYNSLIFDYPGYGESTGEPTEKGTYEAALACWDYLVDQRGIRPESIVVFGRSLGGGIASWLAVRANPGALVLEAAFSSVPDMAALMFPYLPVRLFCRIKYDNVANVKKVGCPVLVAHSRVDKTCPYEQGERVYSAALEPKLFVEMQGGHNDGGLDSNPRYQAALAAFVTEHL